MLLDTKRFLETDMFDWSQVDWAVVLATFCGPVVAVGITLWHQGRSARKEAQRSLYATMMRSRRNPMSLDFVGAFNLVPVHFHREQVVMESYNKVLEIVNNAAWGQPEARARLNENFATAVAKLLSCMSSAVGLPVEQITILSGAYSPQGWADDEQEQAKLRSALMDVLVGARPLPVVVAEERPVPQIEQQRGLEDMMQPQKKPATDGA